MLQDLIKILADGELHSGAEIGRQLGVTRSAVWKSLKALDGLGLELVSEQSKGYRLKKPLDLLEPDQLLRLAHLSADTQLEVLHSIDSTNTRLADLLHSGGLTSPMALCFAEHQTGGRGRRGRDWYSPYASNIYGSCLAKMGVSFGMLSGFSLAVGASVCQFLARDYGVEGLGLKWPNDIYLQERKLGGILIELYGEQSGPVYSVVGLGLNLSLTDKERASIGQPAAALEDAGIVWRSRTELAAGLAATLVACVDLFVAKGFEGFSELWKEYDCMLGREVRITGFHDVLEGIYQGVDGAGNLVLKTPKETRVVSGGEVSLRSL